MQFLFVTVVPKYLNFTTISTDVFFVYVMILPCALVT